MIELTNEQLQALEAAEGALQVVNPRTGQTFVLLRQDVYDRMRQVVEGPNRRGWDDPALDVYERCRSQCGSGFQS
jgi:hypothetical protein